MSENTDNPNISQVSGTYRSPPSVTVTYGSVNVGLYLQEGKDIRYTSLDRAGAIIAHMPVDARRTLLAPIEQGLIDPQSVFYLIDNEREGKIAVCVEDFVQLASTCFLKEEAQENLQQQQHTYENAVGN